MQFLHNILASPNNYLVLQFADDSHLHWGWYQSGWWWWRPTTTTATPRKWVLHTISRKPVSHGGNAAPYCIEHGLCSPAESRYGAKSIQHIQGIFGHQASHLQGGRVDALGRWMVKHYWAKVLPVESYWTNEGRMCILSITGTGRDLVDSVSVYPTCWCQY